MPVVPTFPGMANITRVYSPITLNKEWPTLTRLVVIVILAVVGAIINGFFVASFFIQHELKRIGNIYHTCLGVADMMVAAIVIPISAVVLISKEWDLLPVCNGLQFVTEASTYCYSLFFCLIAAETYLRACHSRKVFDEFMSMGVGLVSLLVFILGYGVAFIGIYLDYDYDYCARLHYGYMPFRIATMVMFHIIPFILTIFMLFKTKSILNQPALLKPHYRKTYQYFRDVAMVKVNIAAYFLFVMTWLPYVVIIYWFPDVTDSVHYITAWAGVCRPILSCILYGCFSPIFSQAYTSLFYYCCCKISLRAALPKRHRRVYEHNPNDIRVHMMQTSRVNHQVRGRSTTHETLEL